MIKYGILFIVLLSLLKSTNTATTYYDRPQEGAFSLREAINLIQQLIEQNQESETKDAVPFSPKDDFSSEGDISLSFEMPDEDWRLNPIQIVDLNRNNLRRMVD